MDHIDDSTGVCRCLEPTPHRAQLEDAEIERRLAAERTAHKWSRALGELMEPFFPAGIR